MKVQLSLGFGHQTILESEKPQLRSYQQQGVDDMRKLVNAGARRLLLTMPTGGGKTVLASCIIDAAQTFKRRVLFIAHRIELINQTAIQLARFGITDIGVIKGTDKRSNPDAPVQVASIDTLRNRSLGDWVPDIIIIDEAHRALADSYRVLFTQYPDALHIGLTATPFRTDNQGLGELYQQLVVCAKPSQLIEDGFILDPRIFAGPLAPDITSVEYSAMANDFHNGQLGSAMMKRQLVGNIVEEWVKRANGRRTVCFAVNVEHSKMIVDEFYHACVRAAHIDGNTPADERSQILLRLEKGELQVVSNCDVLSEGWDQPSVKCAILARPTASVRLHLQQCGRILRPYYPSGASPDSESIGALILDHAGNCARHGLPQDDRVFDLQTGSKKSNQNSPAVRVCEKCYAIFSGLVRTCPECGHTLPVQETKQITHDETVELVELKQKPITTEAERERLFFLKEVEKARKSGMKPGAAGFRFKEKFSKWPPWSWSQQVTAMFNSDLGWQELVNQRAQVRKHWEQARADQMQPSQPQPVATSYTEEVEEQSYYEDEIPF